MVFEKNHQESIDATKAFMEETLAGAEGSHDVWHIRRVHTMAKRIAAEEGADRLVVELGALLHDIADAKFHNGDDEIGPRKAKEFLESIGVEESVVEHVENIIRNISFRKSLEGQEFRSLELDVVQDADRLDALGAIGIARTFAYNGAKGRQLYDPAIKPNLHMTKEEYKASTAPTVNHFYEKLLLLKDRMNTATGRRLAEGRHVFMEQYLEEFYDEWEGKI
ncbi:MAG: HD domain-containing protein [Candidatus Moranbacteria bacterium]|nr:HD domain-containing protein [Candidatus Moranbacteria bacterium]